MTANHHSAKCAEHHLCKCSGGKGLGHPIESEECLFKRSNLEFVPIHPETNPEGYFVYLDGHQEIFCLIGLEMNYRFVKKKCGCVFQPKSIYAMMDAECIHECHCGGLSGKHQIGDEKCLREIIPSDEKPIETKGILVYDFPKGNETGCMHRKPYPHAIHYLELNRGWSLMKCGCWSRTKTSFEPSITA